MQNQEKIPVRIRLNAQRYEVSASLFDVMLKNAIDPRHTMGEDDIQAASPEEEMLMGITEDEDSESEAFVRPLSPETLRSLLSETKENTPDDGIDRMEILSEGYLLLSPIQDGNQEVTITYDETELTGMEGAHSTITFCTDEPDLVHLIRGGSVTTAMTFKPHHRAICVYQTPYMPFQVGIHCLGVVNTFAKDGIIQLDYIIEIKGAQAERCSMTVEVL